MSLAALLGPPPSLRDVLGDPLREQDRGAESASGRTERGWPLAERPASHDAQPSVAGIERERQNPPDRGVGNLDLIGYGGALAALLNPDRGTEQLHIGGDLRAILGNPHPLDRDEHPPPGGSAAGSGQNLELHAAETHPLAFHIAGGVTEHGEVGGSRIENGNRSAAIAKNIKAASSDHHSGGNSALDGDRVCHAETINPPTARRNRKERANDTSPAKGERTARERLSEVMAQYGDPGLLLAAAHALLAKRRFSHFVRQAWHVLEPGVALDWWWHLDLMCDTIQAALEGWLVAMGRGSPQMVERADAAWKRHGLERPAGELLVQNLALNVPPGTLKSRILMVFAPAWMWLHAPDWTVLATSGNPDNVKRDSLAHRDLVESRWYRETFSIGWKLREDVDAVDKWSTTAGGERLSRGFVSSFTGIHVDCILVDDPDDAHKVFSEPARREVHGKWTRAIKNRVKSPELSLRIGIQQRVHVDDWTNHVCGGASWSPTHRKAFALVALPMEFGKGPANSNKPTPWGAKDPRTVEGEVLHPARFTPAVLADERRTLGSAGYAAQQNQNPDSLEGGAINRAWFRFCRIAGMDATPRPRPDGCSAEPAFVIERHKSGALKVDSLTVSVDATFGSIEQDASAVGLLVIANVGGRRCILDDRTEPLTFLDTVKRLREIIRDWGPGRILIEKKANGAAVIERLAELMARGDLLGPDGKPIAVVVEPIEPEGGKESRAAAMIPAIEAGLVFILEGAPWLESGRAENDNGFLGEVCRFPNAKRDDRVDALSQHMNHYGVSTAAGRLLALCVA